MTHGAVRAQNTIRFSVTFSIFVIEFTLHRYHLSNVCIFSQRIQDWGDLTREELTDYVQTWGRHREEQSQGGNAVGDQAVEEGNPSERQIPHQIHAQAVCCREEGRRSPGFNTELRIAKAHSHFFF